MNVTIGPADGASDERADVAAGLWNGDTGVLGMDSRRALLDLIKGPYLSGRANPGLWAALLADETAIRSRLHELFLDLVVDRVGEFAFVRNVDAGEVTTPRTVRTESLTFLDTAMLLVLRQMLLAREGEGRVIVGQDEVFEQLRPYRPADHDEKLFGSRLNSSWMNMKNKLRVIHQAGAADGGERAEISPVLRLIVDAEQVRQIEAEYRRIAGRDAAGGAAEADPDLEELSA
ncbi:DUF4194 domain-containing protein [Agromyces sp. H66]|uniref:DUF4194 domain-containing protein n=1 Tax=Agromyces sp. H66 TaxID=2529859 RepID=UPI0020C16193|nr:DUF4194 domain-containing protein [Agromyces sp. H66]